MRTGNADATARAVVCFGEALIDFLARPGEDIDAPRSFVQYAGGAPANVAVAVARLGGRSEFVGMFGEDMFGDFLLDSLARHGVGTRHSRRTAEAGTALAFVALDANGERSFSFYRPPAADLMFRPADFDPACFAEAAIFHVCSNSLTEEAIAEATLHGMRQARAQGVLASMDLNLRPSLWSKGVDPLPRLWAALEEADIVKLARNELDHLAGGEGGEDAVYARLWNAKARLVVVTDGDAPLQWRTRDREGALDAFVVRAIDTTAAGDAFVGSLLYQFAARGTTPANIGELLSNPAALADMLGFAAACGAIAVTRHGAFAAMPTLQEARTLFDAARAQRVSTSPEQAGMNALPDFRSAAFLRAHIVDTMAFYHPRCIDPAGGFFHYFRDDGTVYDRGHRHLVSSTRFVFNYAMAYRAFADAGYLDVVRHGLRFLRDKHRNPATGGYAWTLRDGRVEDDMNHCYGVAFVLLAYSHALMAGVEDARGWMEETWELLEKHFWEAHFGLYRDEADAQWNFSGYRGQNANMHMCEAMLAAFEASGERRYLDRALTLADNMTRRQAAMAGGLVWEHYDSDWNIDWNYHLDDPKHLFRPWGFQPGHQTEWAKLLMILDRHVDADWLVPTARHLFDAAVKHSWDDQRGGLYYGFAPESRRPRDMTGAPIGRYEGEGMFVCDDDKYFWVQAESLAAAALLAARTGDAVYWNWYERLWTYSWKHLVDHRHGAWYRILDADNRKYGDEKSPAGKTDYHTMGACYEALNALD